jgi:uncharacterized membrane protein
MRNEIIILLLLCTTLAQAQENISSIFMESKVSAPGLPTEEITGELTIVLMDVQQNFMGNKHTLLEIGNPEKGTTEKTLRYSDENGIISLNLEPGNWRITAGIDDLSTAGKDYISDEFDLTLTDSRRVELFMFPVGTLKGNVYNEQGERIVRAKVRIDCGRDYGDRNTTTDEFGCFSLDYVPVGACEVMALSDNIVGSVRVNITRGGLKTTGITLGQGVKSSSDLTVLWAGAFLIVVILVVIYYPRKKRSEPQIIKVQRIELTDRMQDIIQTLTSREKSIVNLMIENDGKLSQAEARHFLKIPKATISRDIYSLEQKKIVETIKIGRNKDMRLTKWFLGLEEQKQQS